MGVCKPQTQTIILTHSSLGLTSHPVTTDQLAISMGERYEILINFENHANQNITLRNNRGIGENVDYAATDLVMQFNVGESVTDTTNNGPASTSLRDIPPVPTTQVIKDFTFMRTEGVNGEWVVNGVGFSDIKHRILTKPTSGTEEIWTFHNLNWGGTHPIHIHLVDFHVLSRTGGRNFVHPYESAGMKDIVWLAGGETVQVVARYAPWNGV